MSPYWLHPDSWPDGGSHHRPRNHGPRNHWTSPAGSLRANADWIPMPAWFGGEVPDPDRALALRVAEELIRDQAVRGRRVEVTVRGTVVILDGEIESPHARSAAEICARAIPGVSEVANRLIVS
jgi:hypothetical protein